MGMGFAPTWLLIAIQLIAQVELASTSSGAMHGLGGLAPKRCLAPVVKVRGQGGSCRPLLRFEPLQ